MMKKIFLLLVLGAGVLGGGYYYLVRLHPGEEIRAENIEKILAIESPIYYRDGINKIGVLFQEDHRQYVPFAQIPLPFRNAIVAAEDHDFYRHFGFNPMALMRAAGANLLARRVVQGGSTITQQTAKNLFNRQDRSLREKVKELLFALRLEAHHSKEKILEFYCNQFYVSGNGRGLGVAARYYFNKDVSELGVVESAFIAGSVKRPNYYNPFGKGEAKAEVTARQRAKVRTAYVLDQMYKLGMLGAKEHEEYLRQEVPFREGRMSYALNTVMDQVKVALAAPEVEAALEENGIDNVATSGIRVFTTVEKNLQEEAHSVFRKELSRLTVRLEGYPEEELRKSYRQRVAAGTNGVPKVGEFLFARVVEVDGNRVLVTFASESGQAASQEAATGLIDEAGLLGLLTPLLQYQKQRGGNATPAEIPFLLDKLKIGDLVYVSVRGREADNGRYLLDLERYPTVQGALLAMEEGKVRAMVGGAENSFYNRAIQAKRLVGSVMKPLLYGAALQLGWNSADLLKNERENFPYYNRPYYPHPDHDSPYGSVSMRWAGVKSENVASIWLLYHLCDRLSPAEFKELLAHVEMGQGEEESDAQYRGRIRDKYGIVLNDAALYRMAFNKAVEAIGPDLIFDGQAAEFELLRSFHYDDYGTVVKGEEQSDDLEIRQKNARNTFLPLKGQAQAMEALREAVGPGESGGEVEGLPRERRETESGVGLYGQAATGAYGAGSAAPGAGWRRVGLAELKQKLAELTPEERESFWDDILLDGRLRLGTFRQLQRALSKEFDKLVALPLYGPEVLHQNRDFRVLAGLRYLIGLCRQMGVTSQLEPVLSFPLGSNVLSLLEVARIYEGLIGGAVTFSGSPEFHDALCVVERIENSNGEIIFTPKEEVRRLLDAQTSLAVNGILRQVVLRGTGNYAEQNIKLHSRDPRLEKTLAKLDLRLPVLGKTGTSNDYRNSSFVGLLPGPLTQGNQLYVEKGILLAAYVGYDDNAPMVHRGTHITGSSGALPVWTKLANFIALDRDYASQLALENLNRENGLLLQFPELGQIPVRVNRTSGQCILAPAGKEEPGDGEHEEGAVLTFGTPAANGEVELARSFRAYWCLEQVSGESGVPEAEPASAH